MWQAGRPLAWPLQPALHVGHSSLPPPPPVPGSPTSRTLPPTPPLYTHHPPNPQTSTHACTSGHARALPASLPSRGPRPETPQVFRFYWRCKRCAQEFTMKTDPKNSDYVLEEGATRNYEPWRDEDVAKVGQRRGRRCCRTTAATVPLCRTSRGPVWCMGVADETLSPCPPGAVALGCCLKSAWGSGMVAVESPPCLAPPGAACGSRQLLEVAPSCMRAARLAVPPPPATPHYPLPRPRPAPAPARAAHPRPNNNRSRRKPRRRRRRRATR